MKKLSVTLMLVVALFCSSVQSFAWPGDGWGHRGHYRYHDGGWWMGGALVGALVAGAIIESLPPHYNVVYVNGFPYYYDGSYYYIRTEGGYQVVESPQPVVVVAQPVTVVVPHDYIPVQFRGETYYVHNGHWFELRDGGLHEVSDPTKY